MKAAMANRQELRQSDLAREINLLDQEFIVKLPELLRNMVPLALHV